MDGVKRAEKRIRRGLPDIEAVKSAPLLTPRCLSAAIHLQVSWKAFNSANSILISVDWHKVLLMR